MSPTGPVHRTSLTNELPYPAQVQLVALQRVLRVPTAMGSPIFFENREQAGIEIAGIRGQVGARHGLASTRKTALRPSRLGGTPEMTKPTEKGWL